VPVRTSRASGFDRKTRQTAARPFTIIALMPQLESLLTLVRDVTRHLHGDASLDALSRRAGWSPFHLHRALRSLLGETPKRYVPRLRLAKGGPPVTYTAFETWMEESGYRAVGAPWEVYSNDPAESPHPNEWRTEVCWPIAESRQ
jgi:methylphosphotriester-DNA--protein-cysteine methyltransferase